jgi:eukaryotic-like serine/threonine-protein kinase
MTADSPLIGRTLADRFTITELLGEGGMATVYRATQTAEPHQVAVKVMHAEFLADPTFAKRFEREARAVARLNHENTVRVLHTGLDGARPYMVMELIDGEELFEVLRAERSLSEVLAAAIVMQVCEALEDAHALGIVHRDLKPENIMLLRDAAAATAAKGRDPSTLRVKVLDFGLAKIVARTPTSQPSSSESSPSSIGGRTALTTAGTLLGTPEYMSPEQCRADEMIDARSDIYSCGVMLYRMVAGRVPFGGDAHPLQTAARHIREEPVRPAALVQSIHPGLEAIILMALSKSPGDRQQRARQLRDALARILPELSTARLPTSARGTIKVVATRTPVSTDAKTVVIAAAQPSIKEISAAGAPPPARRPRAPRPEDATLRSGLDQRELEAALRRPVASTDPPAPPDAGEVVDAPPLPAELEPQPADVPDQREVLPLPEASVAEIVPPVPPREPTDPKPSPVIVASDAALAVDARPSTPRSRPPRPARARDPVIIALLVIIAALSVALVFALRR